MAHAARTQRIEARLLPHQKTRIERASSIEGVSVSDFVVQHADEAAIRTIHEHETWLLSEENRRVFFNAILNLQEPAATQTAAPAPA